MRDKLWDPKACRLRRSFRLGPSAAAGYADDYAYLISGLLDLYQVIHLHIRACIGHGLQRVDRDTETP